MATISNLFIDQGSDYISTVTVTTVSGLPLNLTGLTAKSQMRKSYASSKAFDFTVEIYDAVGGKIRLSMDSNQTELIQAGRWLYDVEVTEDATGRKKRVVEGIVTVTPQITQI